MPLVGAEETERQNRHDARHPQLAPPLTVCVSDPLPERHDAVVEQADDDKDAKRPMKQITLWPVAGGLDLAGLQFV